MSTEHQFQLVFIPFPIKSHFVSAVETAKLLLQRDQHLSVTVIVTKLPIDTKIDDYINNSSTYRLTFNEISADDIDLAAAATKSPHEFIYEFIASRSDPVRTIVGELMKSSSTRVAGLVIDMFYTPMIDVANEFGINTYVFFTCGAAVLGLFLRLQEVRDGPEDELKRIEDGLDVELTVSTYAHQVPASVFPSTVFDKADNFLNRMGRFRETKGILINTFLEFEPYAVQALVDDKEIPPVYPVGPVLQVQGEEIGKGNEIVDWLDAQPDSSVVFLCFGSTVCFEENQLKEIAVALENSGHRFLWSLRKPPAREKGFPEDYENLDEVLPEGFLERTAGIGKVIGWAPQVDVLSHPATGGFVTHCGWNSTLESVWFGVPMAAWPLAAEQQANAFLLVKELGVAVEIQMDYRKESNVIVEAAKIENAIRRLMDPGNGIREKVNDMKTMGRTAVLDGGSSYSCLGRLLDDIKQS